MANTAKCERCGRLYEAGSEEQACGPHPVCGECRMRPALDEATIAIRCHTRYFDRADKATATARALARIWHGMGLDTRDWDCAGRFEFDEEWYRADSEVRP